MVIDYNSLIGAFGITSFLIYFITLIPTVVIVKHVWKHYDYYKYLVIAVLIACLFVTIY